MVADRLSALLSPASIAFVGGARAQLAANQTRRFGFGGQAWLVGPAGAYGSLSELPAVPDAVFVGVAAPTALDIIAEAAALGVGGAVVYSAGFAETGTEGRALQDRLVNAAGDMVLIGPNCHGFVNARSGAVLWPDVHGAERVESGVALITQSGNVAIDLTMQQRGLPVALVVTLGNQAMISAADCIGALVDDPSITAIGLHIEGIPDSAALGEALKRAAEIGKPVVVLKTGISRRGSVIAGTHTASLAGPPAAHRAFFARYGVAQVATPEALLGALSVAHTAGSPRGRRVVSLSCSGGEASLMADLSEQSDLVFAPFSDAAKADLDRVLDGRVALENPLDYHTFIWGDDRRMESCFTTALRDGCDIGVLVIDFPAPGLDDDDWWPAVEAFGNAAEAADVLGVVTSTLPENLPRNVCHGLVERGLAPIPGMANCLQALAAFTPSTTSPVHLPPPVVSTSTSLDEEAGKRLLADAGFPVPTGERATVTTAAAIAEGLGYPVVVKSLGVAHRTEVGGVVVGVANAQQLAEAVRGLTALGDEILVEAMVTGVVAELIVGLRIEPPVGWTMTLGSGGILAELVADTATILLPASDAQVRSTLETLAVHHLLTGWRGGRRGDLAATVATIVRLGELAVANNLEIEVNPLLVCEEGVWIADTLMEAWK